MIGVAGKPTTTTPTPRFNISRLNALKYKDKRYKRKMRDDIEIIFMHE